MYTMYIEVESFLIIVVVKETTSWRKASNLYWTVYFSLGGGNSEIDINEKRRNKGQIELFVRELRFKEKHRC